jgi:predicted dehydrogenase
VGNSNLEPIIRDRGGHAALLNGNGASKNGAAHRNGRGPLPRELEDLLPGAVREPLAMGIVGCGYWGINYVRVLTEMRETRVVGVCDQRKDRLAEVAWRYGDVLVSTEFEDILNNEETEAVVIATQAHTHYPLAKACIEAGKHVLVEKPLTTTVGEAEELYQLAGERDVVLMVGHTFLYNEAVRTVKRFIEQGTMGRIYYLYAQRTNLGPIRHDVNAVWDLAAHDISIFNFLLESVPEWVSAVGAKVLRNGREDVGFVSLGYDDGVVAHLHVSWADPNKVREVVVVGSDSRIVFNDVDPLERVRIFEKGVTEGPLKGEPSYGEHHHRLRDGDIISPKVDVSEPLKVQCGHFYDCVVSGREPLTDGALGADVVRVLEAIDRSMAQRGRPVGV